MIDDKQVEQLVAAELRDKANQYGLLVTRCHALGMSSDRLALMGLVEDRLWQLVTEAEGGAPALPDTSSVAALQARAEYNKQHAHELFADTLYYGCTDIDHELKDIGKCKDTGEPITWRHLKSLEPVVFTPYGWRIEKEVFDIRIMSE
jgi:hypothetical protein